MLEARDEQWSKMSCSSTLATVRKPLLPTGQVSDNGHDIWVSGDNANIIARNSKIPMAMRNALVRALRKYDGKDTVQVYKDRGVYNMNVRVQHGDRRAKKKNGKDLCATEESRCGNIPDLGERQGDMTESSRGRA